MRSTILIFAVSASLLAPTVSAKSQPARFLLTTGHGRADASNTRRQYVVGDEDNYRFTVSLTGATTASATADIKHKVMKVYDTGDADVLETVSNIQAAGPLGIVQQAPETIKLSAYGVLSGLIPNKPLSWSTFSSIIPVAETLEAGQSYTISRKMAGNPAPAIETTAKLRSYEAGVANFDVQGTIDLQVTKASLKGEIVWNNATHRYDRGWVTLEITSPENGAQISLKITFDRVLPTATH